MLARLLEVPHSETEWNAWSWSHRTSHQRIIQGINSKKGASLQEYPVDPMNFHFIENFLIANEAMHQAMNEVLGLQDVDLESVDLKDDKQLRAWIYLHWQAHQAAEQAVAALPDKTS